MKLAIDPAARRATIIGRALAALKQYRTNGKRGARRYSDCAAWTDAHIQQCAETGATAYELGEKAFHAGAMCCAAMDAEFAPLIAGKGFGKDVQLITKSWSDGWADANLSVIFAD